MARASIIKRELNNSYGKGAIINHCYHKGYHSNGLLTITIIVYQLIISHSNGNTKGPEYIGAALHGTHKGDTMSAMTLVLTQGDISAGAGYSAYDAHMAHH